MSSGMQGGPPSDCGVVNQINGALVLILVTFLMQTIWHHYIECTSMRVGKLNDNLSLKALR